MRVYVAVMHAQMHVVCLEGVHVSVHGCACVWTPL